MVITEFERRRADNLIWNGAGDYTLKPDFRVYDSEGQAELYWNSIIGTIRRLYDYPVLKEFYKTFSGQKQQSLYESCFWIILENAAFSREELIRPVLKQLREDYARRTLKHCDPDSQIEDMQEYRTQIILRGHLNHSLGLPDRVPNLEDRELLLALESETSQDTNDVLATLNTALRQYCGYRPENEHEESSHDLFEALGRLFRSHLLPPAALPPVRHLAFGFGEHSDEYIDVPSTRDHLDASWTRYITQSESGTYRFIQKNFGAPLYNDNQLRQIESVYCTGHHAYAHLYFTRGEYTDDLLSPDVTCRIQHTALEQQKLNRKIYTQGNTVNTLAINRLTEHIRNSLLMSMDTQTVHSDAGLISGNRVWRADTVGDNRIFHRDILGDNGNITVDLLLDASASQTTRQAMVAAQGFIIAESLSRCAIPCRAYSFCSLNGYTVMHLLRDYSDADHNDGIFRYFSAGANRDGLAIRVSAGLLKENTAEHRLLIVLTDCKPNDSLLSPDDDGGNEEYCETFAVTDSAMEVHKARMDGVEVISVFTGDEEDLPAVRRIYGRNFVRIRSLDTFADTVGRLLRNCLHEL